VAFREAGLRVTDGEALGQHIIGEKAPAFVFKRHGKGASLYLNFLDTQYRKTRDPRHLRFMRALLRCAGVTPRVAVTDGRSPLDRYDVICFEDDRAVHAGIIWNDPHAVRGPDVVVNFRRPGHAYDVRDRKYLGQGRSFKTAVPRWRPKLVSLLPCRIDAVGVSADATVHAGQTLAYRVAPTLEGEPTSLVYRIEVSDPDGKVVDAYRQKRRTAPGRAVLEGHVRTALNDTPGRWTLGATEVVSGTKAKTTFMVQP